MRWILLCLWILLGIAYWYVAQNYCCETSSEVISERLIEPLEKLPVKKFTPVSFAYGDDQPSLDARWGKFRDSLVNNLSQNQLLQVKGFEFKDENQDEEGALGLARATNIRKLIVIPEDRIQLASEVKGDSFSDADAKNLVEFRYLVNTEKIKEIDDRTIIYFESNSTNKLDDIEVESYLDDVVERVMKSGETVRLTGHTDATGPEAKNLQLGQDRANVIKTYLLAQGLNAKQIRSTSKGELVPIADNKTAAGRQLNRRTELQIIK